MPGDESHFTCKCGYIHALTSIIAILIFCSAALQVQAQSPDEQIVINSADWIDVYSAICYANLNGIESTFVNSPAQGKILASVLDRSKPVHLIQSSKGPIIAGYRSYLWNEGFTVSSVIDSDSGKELNIELARKIDTKKFIIIDDSYGYNAISVASYSIVSKSYVLFADRENIDEVYAFLKERTVENVIIYGHVDRTVREMLSEFNPEIIDHGDRFEDNLAIVSKYMDLHPSNQVLLTNGEFIEYTIMSGGEPVIFLGRGTVPDMVVEYVKGSDLKTGVVLGNDLVAAARKLKGETGISIFIKFGQGRQMMGAMANPEALDMFYLPMYDLNLDVISGNYNIKTKTVEIIYQNLGETGVFAGATVSIFADDEPVASAGDEEPFFIYEKTKSGRAYEVDLTQWVDMELQAHVYLEYGEARKSLTEVVEKDMILGIIEFEDRSQLEVTGVRYNKRLEQLMLELKDIGPVTSYADAEIELTIEGDSEFVRLAPAEIGDKKVLSERIKLSPADIAENPTVRVHVRYGERPDLPVKTIDEEHPLVAISGYPVKEMAVVVALIVVIGLLLRRKRRKRMKNEDKNQSDD